MDAKKLIVITGPAGSGKTSLRDYVIDKYHAAKVITHTTRAPRYGEQNGIDYYFENNESFNQLHLLEHVEYSNAKYGSSMEGINEAWSKNDLAIIVLDTLGASTYKEKLGNQAIICLSKSTTRLSYVNEWLNAVMTLNVLIKELAAMNTNAISKSQIIWKMSQQ